MNEHIQYWMEESLDNIETARILYDNGKYLDSAFFCHLSMEKMLKACDVKKEDEVPPKIHDLIVLAERSSFSDVLRDDQLSLLQKLNSYQLEGRYPMRRKAINNHLTPEKQNKILRETEVLLKWFLQKLKSEK